MALIDQKQSTEGRRTGRVGQICLLRYDAYSQTVRQAAAAACSCQQQQGRGAEGPDGHTCTHSVPGSNLLLAGSNPFGKVRWNQQVISFLPCRLPCSERVREKACKSRNLAAGRLLAGICLYFGPLRPLFYFNSPDGSLGRLAGRLASRDWPRAGLEDAC
eukprot:COSAG01_NODE_17133_length_1175_cov_5.107807_1_plen_160_part_00